MRFVILFSFLSLLPCLLFAQNAKNDQATVLDAKEKAQFQGGQAALEQFLNLNLRYPSKAMEQKISGEVIVSFVLDEEGEISNIKITKGIGYGCDEEAVRVVSIMPQWEPAVVNGKPIKINYILPILFELPEEYDKKEL